MPGVTGLSWRHEYPITLVAFLVSPGHNYYFHGPPSGGVGPHPCLRPDRIELVAGQGIVGDRFFGKAGPLRAAVSLLAAEAVDEVAGALGREGAIDPVLLRRNVITRGLDVNGLRDQPFELRQADAAVRFRGGTETSPCSWMDLVLGTGARAQLRGRGGLRAMPETGGWLRLGAATVHCDAALTPADAGRARVRRGQLPSIGR